MPNRPTRESPEPLADAQRRIDDIEDIAGGGGTSFLEPLEPEFLREHRPDVVLYFTDGQGPAPDEPPRVPVVWCLFGPWARRPAPWGRVVRIPEDG